VLPRIARNLGERRAPGPAAEVIADVVAAPWSAYAT
jgi:hypothetical protein